MSRVDDFRAVRVRTEQIDLASRGFRPRVDGVSLFVTPSTQIRKEESDRHEDDQLFLFFFFPFFFFLRSANSVSMFANSRTS